MIRKLIKGLKVAREPGFRKALRRGVAASIEHDSIPIPRDIAHVIDVGANRGQFVTWAGVRFPAARFDCFEPLAASRSTLAEVSPGGRDVVVHDVALGANPGTVDFHVTKADDSSSLLEPTAIQTDAYPESAVVETISVPVRTLDGELAPGRIVRPSLLKIDVQGGELDVLRGAPATLREIDYVLVECSFAELYAGQPLYGEIQQELESHGFAPVGMYSPTTDESGRLLQADALFARPESPQAGA